MAFGFPAEYTEVAAIASADRRTAIETVKATLDEMGLGYETFGDGLRANVKMSLESTGEILSIAADDHGHLHVNSRCKFQLFDWGKNKRNVHQFLQTFNRKLRLNPSTPIGATVQPYDNQNQTPLQRALTETK